jgi:hypothetical protein
MKRNLTLTVLSVLQVLFLTFHFTDDTLRARPGNLEAMGTTFVAVPLLVLWLYAALFLVERRAGLVILLTLAVSSIGMPILHMMGTYGVGGRQPAFFFIWTMYVLAVAGLLSMLLAVDGLRTGTGDATQGTKTDRS